MKIAIASGKGGTGKTLVATSLFHVLQTAGYNATLVDCDAEEPNDMLFYSGEQVLY
jgi:MinD superfamily P-loop ATPase